MNRNRKNLGAAILAAALSVVLAAGTVHAQSVTAGSTGKTYSASSGGENAVLVEGKRITLKNVTVKKTGGSSGEDADFYGTNAGVLVKNGGTLAITGKSTITTNGAHANAVFAYGSGSTVNISGAEIITKANNSGGIMVTGGGVLTAKNLTVNTAGNSSAAIRSDRGGGTMTVNGGTYTTTGTGSPAIYSTADVRVTDATLKATASEGVVIEGANSVNLKNCNVVDNNCKLNGQSSTYKNIFIYQSMSGDASAGTGSFTATGSTFSTRKGDTFYITNTTANITLSGNTFTNQSGDFLRAESAAWGTAGSNGGKVTLKASSQKIEGDIIVAKNSSLNMTLSDASTYSGAVNQSGTAGTVGITLKSGCTWTLSGDSYISAISAQESQVKTNGHTLYVNGKAWDGTSSTIKENSAATNSGSQQNGGNQQSSQQGALPALPGQSGQQNGGNQQSSQQGMPPALPGQDGQQNGNGQQNNRQGTPPALPGQDGQQNGGNPLNGKPNGEGSNSSSEAKLYNKGTLLKDTKGSAYLVLKKGSLKKTTGQVSFAAPSAKTVTSVNIPAVVTLDGVKYKVTAISRKAFSGCTRLKKVTIGKNVSTIGAQAFAGCSSLKNLVIRTSSLKLSAVKAKAFQGTADAITVTVPSKKLTAYKKILLKRGISKTAAWKKS